MATPIVVPDLAHPSASMAVTYDSFSSQGVFGIPIWNGVRVFQVTNLEDGSFNQSATMLARSLRQFGIPAYGSNHPDYPNNNSVVIGYDSAAVPGSDNAAFVLVIYKTLVLSRQAQQPGQAFIDSDQTQTVESTTQLHPDTFDPFQFSWSDPADPRGAKQSDTATLSFPITLRRIVAYGVYSSVQMDSLVRPAVRSVNDNTFLGLPAAYWRFTGLQSNLTLSSSSLYLATMTIETKVDVDWRAVAIFRDTHTGKYVQVDPAVTATAKSTPYSYQVFYRPAGKGIIVSGNYPVNDFGAIFGFGT